MHVHLYVAGCVSRSPGLSAIATVRVLRNVNRAHLQPPAVVKGDNIFRGSMIVRCVSLEAVNFSEYFF